MGVAQPLRRALDDFASEAFDHPAVRETGALSAFISVPFVPCTTGSCAGIESGHRGCPRPGVWLPPTFRMVSSDSGMGLMLPERRELKPARCCIRGKSKPWRSLAAYSARGDFLKASSPALSEGGCDELRSSSRVHLAEPPQVLAPRGDLVRSSTMSTRTGTTARMRTTTRGEQPGRCDDDNNSNPCRDNLCRGGHRYHHNNERDEEDEDAR